MTSRSSRYRNGTVWLPGMTCASVTWAWGPTRWTAPGAASVTAERYLGDIWPNTVRQGRERVWRGCGHIYFERDGAWHERTGAGRDPFGGRLLFRGPRLQGQDAGRLRVPRLQHPGETARGVRTGGGAEPPPG